MNVNQPSYTDITNFASKLDAIPDSENISFQSAGEAYEKTIATKTSKSLYNFFGKIINTIPNVNIEIQSTTKAAAETFEEFARCYSKLKSSHTGESNYKDVEEKYKKGYEKLKKFYVARKMTTDVSTEFIIK